MFHVTRNFQSTEHIYCNNFTITFSIKTSIIKIGNSKGISLSKTILERYNIKDKVEIILEQEHIVLKPIEQSRLGWRAAFEKMHKHGEDQFLIDDVFDDENFDK